MKKIVAVDVDGVLAQYDGWKGIDHIGDPILGAVEFTRDLSAYVDVLIFTSRCCEELNKPEKAHLLRDRLVKWLDQHGFTYADVYVGQGKPPASAYIDDRAVVCRPQENGRLAFDLAFRDAIRLAK
jgi:hypothetical protein